MFSNIDYTHKDVREEVTNWCRWMIEHVGIDGFRLDAVQHFSFSFTRDWIQAAQQASIAKRDKDIFIVGEVWTGELDRITNWLSAIQAPSGPHFYAYDSPLLYNFSRLSQEFPRRKADLRTTLRGSLVKARPEAAVTLVTNHDTQPGQTSYTPMSSALKPFFYAFVLLRQEGLPCVFWGDLFGTQGPHAEKPISDSQRRSSLLANLMLCRRLFAYGKQTDYWKSRDCIGWTRAGTSDKPGCAVIFSIGNPKMVHSIEVAIGKPGDVFVELLGNWDKEVIIGQDGRGRFCCCAFDVCVYVQKGREEIKSFPVEFESAR